LGAARSSADDRLVAAALGWNTEPLDRPPSQPPRSGLEAAMRAWAMCRAGDPEEGYRLLRDHVEDGFTEGWGIWREGADAYDMNVRRTDGPRPRNHATSAALIPCALLFGLLGASADAAYGRLRLAPRFPAAWSNIGVTGIRVADALLELDYLREAGEHVFRVRQRSGRIPVMLVFEPELPVTAVGVVLVDGVPAQLDTRSAGGRTALRVQLPLEREREIRAGGKRIAGTR
jgi:hypothetical protein